MLLAALADVQVQSPTLRVYWDRVEYTRHGKEEQVAWQDELPPSMVDWSDCGTKVSVSNGRMSIIIDTSRVNAVQCVSGMRFLHGKSVLPVHIPEEVNLRKAEQIECVSIRGGWRDGEYVWGTSAFGLLILSKLNGKWKEVARIRAGEDFTGQNFSQEINGRMILGCGNVALSGTTLFEFQPAQGLIQRIQMKQAGQKPQVLSFAWSWIWSAGNSHYIDGATYQEWQMDAPVRWRVNVPSQLCEPIRLHAIPITKGLPLRTELLAEVSSGK